MFNLVEGEDYGFLNSKRLGSRGNQIEILLILLRITSISETCKPMDVGSNLHYQRQSKAAEMNP